MDLFGVVLGAIAQVSVEAGLDKAKRRESILQILKKLSLDPAQPPADFEGVYTYALVQFGVGKPPAVLELFRHELVRDAFRGAFEKGNLELVSVAVQDLIDWHSVGEAFREMDVDPRRFIGEFAEEFQRVVARSRPAYAVRDDQKLDALLDRSGDLLGGQTANSETLQQILSTVTGLAASTTGATATGEAVESAEERVLDAQISQAGALINEGKVLAAKGMLETLAKEMNEQKVSDRVRFRLETNLAACFYYLSDSEQAAEHFDRALAFDPDGAAALGHAALGAFLCDRYDRANRLAHRALENDPEEPTALSVLLQASHHLGEFDLVSEEVKAAALRHPDSRRAMAAILGERGDLGAASELYRLNLEFADSQAQDAMLLAQVIAARVRLALQADQVLPWRISGATRKALEEAEVLATRAVEAWRLDDSRNRYHEALVTRSGLRGMLGKPESALEDCRAVFQENRSHFQALINGGLAAIQLRRWNEAVAMLEQALAVQNRPDAQILLAVVYLQQRRYRDVLRILGEARIAEHVEDIDRLELVAQAYHGLGEEARGDEIVEQLRVAGVNNARALEAVASVRMAQHRFEDAEDCLRQAFAQAQGEKKKYIGLMLANVYLQMGRYQEAVPLYEAAVDVTVDRQPTRDYLVALLNAGYQEKALSIAKALRDDGQAIPVVSVVEARVAEYIGDLDLAHQLYSQLADLEPENTEHLFRAAVVDARRGRLEDAARVFDTSVSQYWQDAECLIAIAQLWASAKRPTGEILRVAYQARRIGANYPEVHLSYAGLVLRAENVAGFLHPDCVAPDTAIRIRSRDQQRWITIIDDPLTDKARGEFSLQDPLVLKLLGRKAGESVSIKESPYEELRYEIVEIQSKYVRALQDTFDNFGTWFPEHPGLHKVEVPLDDPSRLLALSGRQSLLAKLVYEEYARGKMPIGVFAQLIGRSQIEVWGGLTSGEGQLKAALGTPNEQAQHSRLAEQACSVTIDLISLLTLAHLKCLDLVRDRFEAVYVAQTVVDELSEEIYGRQLFAKGQGFAGIRDGRYFYEEIPEEAIQRGTTFLEDLRTWILATVDVVPASLLLRVERERYEQLSATLGASAIDSILVASERDTILLSDDSVLRAVARSDFGVQGVWTQPILKDCWNRGLMAADAFYDATSQLISANYHFVPISSDLLVHFLESHQWIVSSAFMRLLQQLAGTATSEQSVVEVAADFLKAVWLKRILLEHQAIITDLCLDTLTRNRLPARVVPQLREAMRQRLQIAPIQLQQIEHQISSWQRLRRFTAQPNSLWN